MARLPDRAAAARQPGSRRSSGSHVKMTLMLLVVLAGVASLVNLAPSALHGELHARTAGAELRQLTGAQRAVGRRAAVACISWLCLPCRPLTEMHALCRGPAPTHQRREAAAGTLASCREASQPAVPLYACSSERRCTASLSASW